MQHDHDQHTETEPVRHDGTVTRLFADRWFGFLTSPHTDDGRTLFFHAQALRGVAFDALEEGARLTYVEGLDPDGRPCALDVRLVESEDAAVA